MKKNSLLVLASVVTLSAAFTSCSSPIALTKVQESKEIKLPFSEKEYKTNSDFVRARSN